METLIADLALEGHLLDAAKIGILGGSAVSAVAGLVVLRARSGNDANGGRFRRLKANRRHLGARFIKPDAWLVIAIVIGRWG